MPTVITNYLHATYLFGVALRAAKAKSGRTGQPVVAIVFCASALEAFINECGRLARIVPTASKQNVVDSFACVMHELEDRRETLAVKYHLGLLVFRGATWDEGSQPLQDFRLLIAVRNEIVHMKGDTWEAKFEPGRRHPERTRDQYPKFVRELHSRNLIPTPSKSTSSLEQLSNPTVAAWACRTAVAMTQEFYASVPDGYFKQSLAQHLFQLPAGRRTKSAA
jgi:hypothetical protein